MVLHVHPSIKDFLKVDQLDLYLFQHTVFASVVKCSTIQPSNDFAVSIFPVGYHDDRTSVKGEVEACIFLYHLFCETVTRTCTHLMERGHLLLHNQWLFASSQRKYFYLHQQPILQLVNNWKRYLVPLLFKTYSCYICLLS